MNGKGAYSELCKNEWQGVNPLWNLVWKLRCPQRVKTFLWLTCKDRLPTKMELYRRHILLATNCPLCSFPVEDAEHILRNCCAARMVWSAMPSQTRSISNSQMDFDEWILLNLGCKAVVQGASWNSIFAITCYYIWHARNTFIFQNIEHSPLVCANKSVALARIACLAESKQSGHGKRWKQIGWEPPQQGWISLNTDGAMRKHGKAAAGGILRDNAGNWIAGFSHAIGCCSALEAELWDILDGLELAWKLNIKHLLVGCDNREALDDLLSNFEDVECSISLVRRICALTSRCWLIKFKHILREANKAADLLAHLLPVDSPSKIV